MNAKNLQEMIEQYKREMLTYNKSSTFREERGSTEELRWGEKEEQTAERVKTVATEPVATEPAATEPAVKEAEYPAAVPAVATPVQPEAVEQTATSPVPTMEEAEGTREFDELREGCTRLTPEQQQSSLGTLCNDLEEFLQLNSANGSMGVNVSVWNSNFGVSNARVIVLAPLESGNVVIFKGLTDTVGRTPVFDLPAPPRQSSLTSDPDTALPYAGYTVLVEHPDYARAVFTNVPVFEGTQSVQPVSLFPKNPPNQRDSQINVIEPNLK
ncbi:MAG: hypothetical protein IJC37_01395 [Clostridia bacterium]|nr:hypothetical protein [Clostridia bacterium]